jgi:hypothetical protein
MQWHTPGQTLSPAVSVAWSPAWLLSVRQWRLPPVVSGWPASRVAKGGTALCALPVDPRWQLRPLSRAWENVLMKPV